MKIDRSAPLRIDPEAPRALREFARAGSQRGPSDAAVERMSKRLAMAGVLPGSASPTKSVPRAEPKLASYKVGFLAIAIAGGLLFTWRATEAPPGAATTAPVTSVEMNRGPTDRVVNLPDEPGPAEQMEALNPPATSVDQLPFAPPSAHSQASASAPRTTAKSSNESAGSKVSSTEVDLVLRAQVALASDPERALTLTSEHARAYPNGEFVQEREVIAVEALSRLGRREESLRRALSLVQRFPRTPYARRLEVATGRPLSPAANATDQPSPSGTAGSHSAKAP